MRQDPSPLGLRIPRSGGVLLELFSWREPCQGAPRNEERSERRHGVCNDGDTSFHLTPEEDPDDVILAVAELVASGADDICYYGEDTETEKGAQADFTTKVDLHILYEDDGNGYD